MRTMGRKLVTDKSNEAVGLLVLSFLALFALSSAQFPTPVGCVGRRIAWNWNFLLPGGGGAPNPLKCQRTCWYKGHPLSYTHNATHCVCGTQPVDYKGVVANRTCTASEFTDKRLVTVYYDPGLPNMDCRFVKPQIWLEPIYMRGTCQTNSKKLIVPAYPKESVAKNIGDCPGKMKEFNTLYVNDSMCGIPWEFIIKLKKGCYEIKSYSNEAWKYGIVKFRDQFSGDPDQVQGPIVAARDGKNFVKLQITSRLVTINGRTFRQAGTFKLEVVVDGVQVLLQYFRPDQYLKAETIAQYVKANQAPGTGGYFGMDGGSNYLEWQKNYVAVYFDLRSYRYDVGKWYKDSTGRTRQFRSPAVDMTWSFQALSTRPVGGSDLSYRWLELKDDNRHVMCKPKGRW